MKNQLIVLTLSLIPISSSVYAQISGGAFLKNTAAPASDAMGNSGVVTSWGSQAVGANPANLGFMSRRMEVFTSYQALSGDIKYGHLAAAVSLPASRFLPDALGLSVTRQQVDGMESTDASNNSTGSFGAGDTAVGLSASKGIGALRFGLTGIAIQSEIAGYKSRTALAADIGLSCSLRQFYGLSLGAGVNNLGQEIQFLDQKDSLPTSISFGAALPMGPAMLTASVNRLLQDQKTNVGFGMAYGMGPVELMGGYKAQQGSGANLAARDASGIAQMAENLSGGLSVKMGQTARLDYAFSPGATELGPNQKVALTLAWGNRESDSNKVSQSGNRGNTRMINRSSTQETNPDAIDWHLINTQEK